MPGKEDGVLVIKFRRMEAKTDSVEAWKGVFENGELLRGKEG